MAIDCDKVKAVSVDCDCSCPEGGWCEPHQIKKTKHYVHLCKTKAAYRMAWNECRGPGQGCRSTNYTRPGDILRQMLGCSAKHWGHFREMNQWGERCSGHLEELASSLVEDGYITTKERAERLITTAIKKAKPTEA